MKEALEKCHRRRGRRRRRSFSELCGWVEVLPFQLQAGEFGEEKGLGEVDEVGRGVMALLQNPPPFMPRRRRRPPILAPKMPLPAPPSAAAAANPSPSPSLPLRRCGGLGGGRSHASSSSSARPRPRPRPANNSSNFNSSAPTAALFPMPGRLGLGGGALLLPIIDNPPRVFENRSYIAAPTRDRGSGGGWLAGRPTTSVDERE